MPETTDPTLVHSPETEPVPTVVRPAPTPAAATDETLVRGGTPAPQAAPAEQSTRSVTSGSAGFSEDTRQLLRKRLMVTHGAIGFASLFMVSMYLLGIPVIPCEAGLGKWALGLPLLGFGQSVAGLLFILRRPEATLRALRFVEVTQFGTLALGGAVGRFLVLTTPPAESVDERYHDILYRHDSLLTSYPLIFAIVLYGVVIPNTRRRSLIGSGLLCLVPLAATGIAAAVNVHVHEEMREILPVTILPLAMAALIAVFCAVRASDLRRAAFDALREAKELGSYTLKKKLGEGGMGEVWLAEHRLLKRPCAMKFIRAELAANPDTARRFEREVRAVTALTHFNTVRIFDYGSNDDGSFFYVMEYLDGPTLDKLVKEHGPLPPARAVYILRQLCGALAEAHMAGMVHRDLKPNNILVAALGGQRDVAKLLDFGLVQDHSETESDDRITRAGTVLGTPSYMCPEQAAGESVDARGDLYSLGCVAFFMLTGRPPFEGGTVGKLISAHLTQPAPEVRTLRKDVPSDVAEVVAKCLTKEPKSRFQSATELDAALAACSCSMEWSACAAASWWQATSATVETPPPASSTDCTQTMNPS
jgi:serine/threonine-protein kinase